MGVSLLVRSPGGCLPRIWSPVLVRWSWPRSTRCADRRLCGAGFHGLCLAACAAAGCLTDALPDGGQAKCPGPMPREKGVGPPFFPPWCSPGPRRAPAPGPGAAFSHRGWEKARGPAVPGCTGVAGTQRCAGLAFPLVVLHPWLVAAVLSPAALAAGVLDRFCRFRRGVPPIARPRPLPPTDRRLSAACFPHRPQQPRCSSGAPYRQKGGGEGRCGLGTAVRDRIRHRLGWHLSSMERAGHRVSGWCLTHLALWGRPAGCHRWLGGVRSAGACCPHWFWIVPVRAGPAIVRPGPRCCSRVGRLAARCV